MLNSTTDFSDWLYVRTQTITSRKKPKIYHTYYIGPYISHDKFTLKLGETGYQGFVSGVGATFGLTLPLYEYKGGSAIDVEFGASAGIVCTAYDKFKYSSEDKCYIGHSSRKVHVAPFPVVSELRVGLVYRMNSIRHQVLEHDTEKLRLMEEAYRQKISYEEKVDTFLDPSSVYYYSDSINVDILKKNQEIRRINRKYANVDSTMLLQELALVYSPLSLPKKILYSSHKKTLPNKEITSVKELKNPYINKVVKEYEDIPSIEDDLLFVYRDVRTKILNDARVSSDSLKPIPYLEFLTKAALRINEFSIYEHNKKYFGSKENVDQIIVDSLLNTEYTYTTADGAKKFQLSSSSIAMFQDTIYLKNDDIRPVIVGQNKAIEIENTFKRVMLEKLYGVSESEDEKH